MKIFKAVIYCRLSKEDGDKAESNSIGSQKAYCEDYINKQKGIKIVREPIVDDGVSGVSFDRPGFKQLEKEIKEGKINCIVVRDLSRFSRNYIDAGRYLEKIFPSLNVRFIAINDNYDSLDMSNDTFVLPFKNLINDTYCKDISMKIRSSLEVKKKNGEYTGAFCPYGYKRDENNRNKLAVDENVRETIQMIFSLFKDGISIGKIADRLNQMGVLSPMEYKRSAGIKFETVFKTSDISKWEYNTVKRILTNECYIGVLTQGKRGTPNYKVRQIQNKNESEWIKVCEAHEPLISHDDFFSVNELLTRDMRSTSDMSENPLSGFLFCADCGASMVRKTVPSKGKKYVYYVCSKNKKHKECSTHSIALSEIESKILSAIHDQVELVLNIENIIGSDMSHTVEQRFSYENQISLLKDEVTRYKKLKLRLYEDLNDGIITKDEYLEFKQTYSNIESEKEQSILRIEKECNQAIQTGTTMKNWVVIFKEYENFNELSRRVLLALVSKIKVYENHTIEIIFKYSDEYNKIVNYILKSKEVIK